MIFSIPTNILNKKFSCYNKNDLEFEKEIFWKRIYYINFKQENFRETPKNKMKKFFDLINDFDAFRVDADNNKYLTKMFNSNLKKLESNKEWENLEDLQKSKNEWLLKMASKFTNKLHNDYKTIVCECFIKQNYPPEFICLMLNEVLNRSYIQQIKNDNFISIIKKRELHKTIEGYITLNKFIVQYIYDNGKNFKSFKETYFQALKNYKQYYYKIPKIDNIQTFGKGNWLIFNSDKNFSRKFKENAQILYSIIQYTNWCTVGYITSELKDSSFYIFIDNDGNPHIAAKITNNCLEEIRGIHNDKAQEIEDEYLNVAEIFLKSLKNIKQSHNWLKDVQWNIRLKEYIKVIKQKQKINIKKFLEDYRKSSYRAHSGIENSRKKELYSLIPNILQQIQDYFNLDEKILLDANVRNLEELDKCKIILGTLILSDFKEKYLDISNLVFCNNILCYKNSKIKKIKIPKLKKIHEKTFMDCANLEAIDIPDGVENIEKQAFCGCKKLRWISLPKSLSNIECEAFSDCKSLKEINIPDNVKNVGRRAFSGCTNLEIVKLPKNLINLNKGMFSNCINLKKIIIPNTIHVIEENVFANCTNLKKVVFPKNLREIKSGAFAGCSNLKVLPIDDKILSVE